MLRRLFPGLLLAMALLLPLGAQAREDKVPYSPEAVQAAMDQGRAVLLEFGASW